MLPAGITPPVLDEMTFFQVGAIVGADLEEKEDPDQTMRMVWDRKEVKSSTVTSSTGVVGKIT